MKNDKEKNLKILLLGNEASGKTCIITRYTKGKFEDMGYKTHSPSYSSKSINIGNKSINLDIWDTPGSERLRDLVKLFYKDANAIVLVYDITNKYYFDDLKNYWYSKLKKNLPKEASKKKLKYIKINISNYTSWK